MGQRYELKNVGDRREPALIVKGAKPGQVSKAVSERAFARLNGDNWPFVWFGRDGTGRPRVKTYLALIKKGKVPVTYWADEEFAFPPELGSTSWDYEESGRSSDGVTELTAIIGSGHSFTTVKPLKLMSKMIQLWCPQDGLVLDPYAGSGTTGHAVLYANKQTEGRRRFILIEQGAPAAGDKYARTLTWQRLKNAITGERPGNASAEPLPGGFEYRLLTKTIDARAVMNMKRDELIDVVITSHWETHRRTAPNLQPFD